MTSDRIQQVRLDELHDSPYQPRQEYDEEALQELARSIRENGILSPLSVRPRQAGGYELIGGHRRSRAARIAGLAEVLETKSDLERKLAQIGNLRDWALQHEQQLGEYAPTARAAALAQIAAAQTALRQVADMLQPTLQMSAK